MNNPLFSTRLTDKEIGELGVQFKGKNIFFGIGLVTQKQISVATPFDILSMFFTAEQLRKFVHGKKIIVFIADQHARTNENISQDIIAKRASETIQLFKKIIHNFNLQHVSIIQTTHLNEVQEIRKIFASLPNFDNDYVKHEVADVCWLQKFHNVGIKLGWSMSSTLIIGGHDERFFDHTIQQFCPNVLFLHLAPGRTFDDKRTRVSPYISIEGENRLVFQNNLCVQDALHQFKKECSPETFKATLRHLSQIARLYDDLFGPIKQKTLTEKLQILTDTAVKNHEMRKEEST